MNDTNRNKKLNKRNITQKKNNTNYSYSLLSCSKLSKNIIKNKDIFNENTNNSSKNNYIIKKHLNSNFNKNINNKIINNSKEVIYSNMYFSLNSSVSNQKNEENMKCYHDNFNHKIVDKFATIEVKGRNNMGKIKRIQKKKNLNINNFKTLENNKINLIRNIKNNKEYRKMFNYLKLNNNKLINKTININNSINNTNNNISAFSNKNNENLTTISFKNKENKELGENNNKKKSNICKKFKNNNDNNFQLSNIKNKMYILDKCKAPTNYCLTEISHNLKNSPKKRIINMERNKRIQELNYIQDKKNKLNTIEIEKQKLIDESYNLYKRFCSLIKKQQKEYKEYDNFLKNEFNDNKNNQLKLKIFYNKLKKGGASNYFKLVKNINKKKSSQINGNLYEDKNKLLNNNIFNYYKNNSINKSIQKYFLLKTNEKNDKNKISKDNNNNNNYIFNKENNNQYSYSNKFVKTNKSINLNEINIKNFKDFRKLKLKNNNNNNKIFKLKKKNLSLNEIYNNKIKIPSQIDNKSAKDKNYINDNKNNYENNKYYDYIKYSSNFINKTNPSQNKKRLILKNRNTYKNFINEKDMQTKIQPQSSTNNKNLTLSYTMKFKSLSKLHELDDYIGPNQYSSIIIPSNNKKRVNRMISEEKERTLRKLRNEFKFFENKRNNEYYSQTKNREINDLDDYYNKKGLDKIILSSEKKSKYNKIKNRIYNNAFKSCKYK